MSLLEQPTQVGDRHLEVSKGLALVGFTIAYMVVEMTVSLWSSYQACSVSLESFGLDSVVEIVLAVVLFWRLRVEARGATGEQVERAERRASWWAGAAFYVLAVFIAANAGVALWTRSVSHPGWWGLGIAVAAVIIMPVVSIAKRRVGRAIGSAALEAEATCSMVCAYMAATLLVGLAATRFLGWWWADPVAALVLLYWMVREGRENFEAAAGRGTCCGCEAHG